MAAYILLALALLIISGSIFETRKRHSLEIYTIWYIFSLFLFLFFALYYFAEREGTELARILGPSYTETLTLIHHALTDVRGELQLVAAVVYLAIAPQLLTYVLSGLSGSATPPLFVRQTVTIAVWSIIKFLAGLGGILLAQPLARLSLGMQIPASDFAQGAMALASAFLTAGAYYQFLERQFEIRIMPGFRVHVRAPILLDVHKFFTRHRQSEKPSVTDVAMSVATQIATSAAAKIAASAAIEIAKSTAMEIAKSSEAEKVSGIREQEDEWLLSLPGLTLHLRGRLPLMARDHLGMLKARQNRPPG